MGLRCGDGMKDFKTRTKRSVPITLFLSPKHMWGLCKKHCDIIICDPLQYSRYLHAVLITYAARTYHAHSSWGLRNIVIIRTPM